MEVITGSSNRISEATVRMRGAKWQPGEQLEQDSDQRQGLLRKSFLENILQGKCRQANNNTAGNRPEDKG